MLQCYRCGATVPNDEGSELCARCYRQEADRRSRTTWTIILAVGGGFLGLCLLGAVFVFALVLPMRYSAERARARDRMEMEQMSQRMWEVQKARDAMEAAEEAVRQRQEKNLGPAPGELGPDGRFPGRPDGPGPGEFRDGNPR